MKNVLTYVDYEYNSGVFFASSSLEMLMFMGDLR